MTEQRASHDLAVPPALAANLATGWAPDVPLDSALSAGAPYAAKRRAALASACPGDTLVIRAGAPLARANDTDYPFRAASDYVWLTGDTEPHGVLVLSPAGDPVLYVPDRVSKASLAFFTHRGDGELWVGRRPGVHETGERLGLECRRLTDLDETRLENARDPRSDAGLATTLAELRLVKDEWELAELRAATDATARGFADALRDREGALVHGERWIEGTFWRRARAEGNDVGYSSIVACGPHATTLHWSRDDGPVRDGDLLLLDMGVEMRSLYTADVTRTVPVDGTFTADQRRVYALVHDAQQTGIAAAVDGADFLAPNRAAMRVLAEGLHDWGILAVTPDEALDENENGPGTGLHRRYTLHNVSHMLGLDVHDCARARGEHYLQGTLAAGMVLTVEPGLYFQPDDLTVPPELRGLGVRIEDDIAVTADGPRNLSDQLPTGPDEVEAWLAGLR